MFAVEWEFVSEFRIYFYEAAVLLSDLGWGFHNIEYM